MLKLLPDGIDAATMAAGFAGAHNQPDTNEDVCPSPALPLGSEIGRAKKITLHISTVTSSNSLLLALTTVSNLLLNSREIRIPITPLTPKGPAGLSTN